MGLDVQLVALAVALHRIGDQPVLGGLAGQIVVHIKAAGQQKAGLFVGFRQLLPDEHPAQNRLLLGRKPPQNGKQVKGAGLFRVIGHPGGVGHLHGLHAPVSTPVKVALPFPLPPGKIRRSGLAVNVLVGVVQMVPGVLPQHIAGAAILQPAAEGRPVVVHHDLIVVGGIHLPAGAAHPQPLAQPVQKGPVVRRGRPGGIRRAVHLLKQPAGPQPVRQGQPPGNAVGQADLCPAALLQAGGHGLQHMVLGTAQKQFVHSLTPPRSPAA